MGAADIRVAVVESREVIRRGLVACLADDPRLKVREVEPEEVDEHEFDVAVVSSEMAAKHHFPCPIAICCDDSESVNGAAAHNEVAAVLKRASMTAAQLHATARAAAAGLKVNAPDTAAGDAQIDARFVQVLELLAQGHSTREIAVELSYSERTIKKLVTQLEQMLDARSRAQVVAQAMRRGLI